MNISSKFFLLTRTQCQKFDCFYRAKSYGRPCSQGCSHYQRPLKLRMEMKDALPPEETLERSVYWLGWLIRQLFSWEAFLERKMWHRLNLILKYLLGFSFMIIFWEPETYQIAQSFESSMAERQNTCSVIKE